MTLVFISNKYIEQYYHIFGVRFFLTNRELEILKVTTFLGFGTRALAELLELSESTIKNHIASILVKTETDSMREIQAIILRETLSLLPVVVD